MLDHLDGSGQPNGQHNPNFYDADQEMQARLYEERRKGWFKRAFKVLKEETKKVSKRLEEEKKELKSALNKGNEGSISQAKWRVRSSEETLAQKHEHKEYLEGLLSQYGSEDGIVEEIKRTGQAHLEWAQLTSARLRDMLLEVGKKDLDAPLPTEEWKAIVSEIDTMKTVFWQQSTYTDVLRKVERSVYISFEDILREEVLDRYACSPASTEDLDPALVADLEEGLRHLECEGPHKLSGKIDTVYGDPLRKDEILLFQLASDAATGWICGDLGLVYVAIKSSDLKAGNFDRTRAWLEA